MSRVNSITMRQLLLRRYRGAAAGFWAGSLSRGLGTPTSDLDLVVVYARLDQAWRESYPGPGGRQVEAFIHDLDSLSMFFGKDRAQGVPVLIEMVADGVSLMTTEIGADAQTMARRAMKAGPEPLSTEALEKGRYTLTDLLDDLTDRKGDPVMARALGAELFHRGHQLRDRAAGRWTSRGKRAVEELRASAFGRRYLDAFDALFETGDVVGVLSVMEEVLAPIGGRLYDWRSDAPPHRSVTNEALEASV